MAIALIQSPAIFCIHNTATEYGFLAGIVFVNERYSTPQTVIDLETKQKYTVTNDIEPGIYYQQEILARAISIQETND